MEKYLRSKGAVVLDAQYAGREHFGSFANAGHPINVTIFRNHGHGDWPSCRNSNLQVAQAVSSLADHIRTVSNDEY